MGKFNAMPSLKPLPDGESWLVESLLIYVLDPDLASSAGFLEVVITAEEGFVTDGASIPRIPGLWSIVGAPMRGLYRRAAIIHDWLCVNHVTSRKIGDKIFKRAMKDDGVSWWKRQLLYGAVRSYAVIAGLH